RAQEPLTLVDSKSVLLTLAARCLVAEAVEVHQLEVRHATERGEMDAGALEPLVAQQGKAPSRYARGVLRIQAKHGPVGLLTEPVPHPASADSRHCAEPTGSESRHQLDPGPVVLARILNDARVVHPG